MWANSFYHLLTAGSQEQSCRQWRSSDACVHCLILACLLQLLEERDSELERTEATLEALKDAANLRETVGHSWHCCCIHVLPGGVLLCRQQGAAPGLHPLLQHRHSAPAAQLYNALSSTPAANDTASASPSPADHSKEGELAAEQTVSMQWKSTPQGLSVAARTLTAMLPLVQHGALCRWAAVSGLGAPAGTVGGAAQQSEAGAGSAGHKQQPEGD